MPRRRRRRRQATNQRFCEALLRKQPVEEAGEAGHRNDERQTRAVVERGHVGRCQHVAAPHVDGAVTLVVDEERAFGQPGAKRRGRSRDPRRA